jgi:hypothetical protein
MLNRLLSGRVPLVLTGALCAACSLSMAPLTELFRPRDYGAVIVYWCFGVIGAQAVLLSIYGVFAAEPAWRRVAISSGGALVLFTMWFAGYNASLSTSYARYHGLREGAILLLYLPLMGLSLQAPLWPMRVLFRWRIVESAPQIGAGERSSLTIRDLLGAMAAIGAALAAAQYAAQLASHDGASANRFWSQIAVAAIVVAVASPIVVLPLMIAGLRARPVGPATAAIVAYAVLVEGVVLGIVRSFGRIDAWSTLGLSIMVASLTATVFVPLRVVRRSGYHLAWRHGDEASG